MNVIKFYEAWTWCGILGSIKRGNPLTAKLLFAYQLLGSMDYDM